MIIQRVFERNDKMRVQENIYRIALPLPFPLKIVYSYALKGKNGWTIIDTGLNRAETIAEWEKFWQEQKSGWEEIEKIVLTHYHPDHYGMAGYMQERSGAKVYMGKLDAKAAHLFWQNAGFNAGESLRDFYQLHGMPTNLANQMVPHMQEFIPWITPNPVITYLSDEEEIYLGDLPYRAILTPGHSDGHFCFYQPEKKILFSGDHILLTISPNISLWPKETSRNPLAEFLNSLAKIERLSVETVLPAHGKIFTNLKERIKELDNHHEERLKNITDFIKGKEKVTAFQVCTYLFGDKLSIHQLRFAMAETLAHLVYMQELGLIKQIDKGEIYWELFKNK